MDVIFFDYQEYFKSKMTKRSSFSLNTQMLLQPFNNNNGVFTIIVIKMLYSPLPLLKECLEILKNPVSRGTVGICSLNVVKLV